jgi:hypothetical protein
MRFIDDSSVRGVKGVGAPVECTARAEVIGSVVEAIELDFAPRATTRRAAIDRVVPRQSRA